MIAPTFSTVDELDPIGRCLRIAHKRGEALRLAREAAQQQSETRSVAILADDTDRADDTLTLQQEVNQDGTSNHQN
jgi:acetolactate synthase regulatory subunit